MSMVLVALAAAGFSVAQLMDWAPQTFSGRNPTAYQLDRSGAAPLLRADCDASASGLVRRARIDLRVTPVLRWTWRVANVYPGIQERSKSGDDYPARVYVVKSGGLLPWRSRAINYVWSSNQPVGTVWPGAYTPEQVRMVAVSSGLAASPPTMTRVVRNVADDFRELLGVDVEQVDAVALMTDCDDARGKTTAWYGAIEFLPLE